MSWDDLQFLLAVAEGKSLAAAGRALGVNHTTVLRRLAQFEEKYGLRVFDRLPEGYVPTQAGQELIGAARQMAAMVCDAERRLAGQDERLEGNICLTATDTLMASLLPEVLAEFRALHPGVIVDLRASNTLFDLTRRDADIAIRPSLAPPDHLVGRRVAMVRTGIYASSPGPVEPEGDWIGPDELLAASTVARMFLERYPTVRIAARSDSILSWSRLAAAGLGQALLPCYLADRDPRLHRRALVPEFDLPLWVLVHPDMKTARRVTVFTEFLYQALGRRRAAFEGAERVSAP